MSTQPTNAHRHTDGFKPGRLSRFQFSSLPVFQSSILLALLAAGMLAGTARGTEYFVAPNGSDSNGGTGWGDALLTISAALAKGDSDIVTVSNGTYNIPAVITVAKAVTIRSFGNGVYGGLVNASNTVVQASGDGFRIFNISHASSVVEGFTIRNGNQNPNVYITDGKLISCIVKDNRGTVANAGGIYMGGGTVSNCIVRNCTAGWRNGGGIYADGGLIVGCQILNNSASNGEESNNKGGGIYANNTTIRNCVIAGNYIAGNGGGVYLQSGLVENCTIVANTAGKSAGTTEGIGGGIYCAGGTILNCIVYNNSAYNATYKNIRATAGVTYTCTTDPVVSGPSNISDDPLFVNAAGGDYTLQKTSPCIDIGANQAWMDGAKDLAGNTRKTYGGVAGYRRSPVVDMGAYEAPEIPAEGTVVLLR